MNNCQCKDSTPRIINLGVLCTITVIGKNLEVGKDYTAVLYYDSRNTTNKAITTSPATKVEDTCVCEFIFPSAETSKLKIGNVIFECYDSENKEKMWYQEDFAKVRPTSLSV